MLHEYHCGNGKREKQGRKGPHFGLEIEFMPTGGSRFNRNRPLMAAYLERVLMETGFPQRLFLLEKDNSLMDWRNDTCGVELIFKPMTYRLLKSLPWKLLFERFQDDNRLDLGHKSAGMHIHLDNNENYPMEKLALLWYDLLHMPENLRKDMFGRNSNMYCCGLNNRLTVEVEEEVYDHTDDDGDDIYTWESFEVLYREPRNLVMDSETRKDMEECRYVPLNLVPTRTRELRVFSSPKNGAQVLAAVDFAKTVCLPDFERRLNLPEDYTAEDFYEALKITALGNQGWVGV